MPSRGSKLPKKQIHVEAGMYFIHVWKQWKQFQNGRQKNVYKESPLTESYSQAFLSLDSFEKFSFPKLKVSRRITFKTKASGGRKFNKQLKKTFWNQISYYPFVEESTLISCFTSRQKRSSTRMGFEPTRAEHIGLAVQRLNHSATSSSLRSCHISSLLYPNNLVQVARTYF